LLTLMPTLHSDLDQNGARDLGFSTSQ